MWMLLSTICYNDGILLKNDTKGWLNRNTFYNLVVFLAKGKCWVVSKCDQTVGNMLHTQVSSVFKLSKANPLSLRKNASGVRDRWHINTCCRHKRRCWHSSHMPVNLTTKRDRKITIEVLSCSRRSRSSGNNKWMQIKGRRTVYISLFIRSRNFLYLTDFIPFPA